MKTVIALLLTAAAAFGAGFGDIPANLSMPAGTVVRRNAGNTLFETFTPGTGSGTVTSITATAPIVVTPSPITTTGVISITSGNLTDAGTDGIVVTGGTSSVLGSGTSIAQHVADTTHNGYLSSTDWNTFNTAASGSVPSTRTLTIGPDTFDLSANRTFLANVTNDAQTKAAIVPNTAPSSGQILIGNAGNTAYAKQTLTGATLSSAGALSGIANASLANSAITIAGTSTSLGGSITLDTITGLSSTGLVKRTAANTLGTITDSSTNWDTAFSQTRQWDGGSTGLVAATGRTSLGATTVGGNIFTLTNPSAVTWIRMNADNTVTARTAAQTLSDIGGGTGSGTVTSIATTSPITGGTITATGTLGLDVSVDHAFTAAQSIALTDTATNSVSNTLTLTHNSSNTPLASYGTRLLFRGKSSTTNDTDMGNIDSVWSVPTHGSRVSAIRIGGASSSGLGSGGNALYVWRDGGISSSITNPGTAIAAFSGGFTASTGTPASGLFLISDGATFKDSVYGLPTSVGTSGNVLTSNGTNITSTAPAIGGNNTGAPLSTTDTTISNQQTPTTGGVTLASQTLASGSVWWIHAFGDYTAANSATARNLEIQPRWNATNLTKTAMVIKASTGVTSSWVYDGYIVGTSTTAAWVTGQISYAGASTVAGQIATGTSTSNTSLTSGAQTIDLRLDTSASVVGDSIVVKQVIITRMK